MAGLFSLKGDATLTPAAPIADRPGPRRGAPIARGAGPWLFDYDGRRYLDASSAWWVNLFGHANPRSNDALTAQLGRLEQVLLAGFTHVPAGRALRPSGLRVLGAPEV